MTYISILSYDNCIAYDQSYRGGRNWSKNSLLDFPYGNFNHFVIAAVCLSDATFQAQNTNCECCHNKGHNSALIFN